MSCYYPPVSLLASASALCCLGSRAVNHLFFLASEMAVRYTTAHSREEMSLYKLPTVEPEKL